MVLKKVMKTYLHLFNKQYPVNSNNNVGIYFLRNSPGMVPVPNSIEEAESVLPEYFDYGILNAHPLYMLNQVLTKVYTPLLSYREDHFVGKMKPILSGEEEPSTNKVDDEKEMRVSLKNKVFFLNLKLVFISRND